MCCFNESCHTQMRQLARSVCVYFGSVPVGNDDDTNLIMSHRKQAAYIAFTINYAILLI